MERTIKPVVAIVGRPNVGKSTLFNRLVGRLEAIVSDVAGTTRDRVATETVWADHAFILVDTGGLELFPETDLLQLVKAQIGVAIEEADVIIALVDVSVGVTGPDRDVADALRATSKPVVLAANKADNEAREATAPEFYELGLGDPIPISAYHNIGIEDLMAQVVERFPSEPQLPEPDADLKLAIVGRTNVGKSMLLNAITGRERAIVSEIPGTTRDALDTLLIYGDKRVLLIDTAGIRRRGSIKPGIERYSVLRAIRAVDRADVAVVLMDASEPATNQDTHIASYVLNAYKGIVLAVNKWDLARELGLKQTEVEQEVRARFGFATYAPVCFTSALAQTGVENLLDTAQGVYEEWTKGVPRYDLRRTVMRAVAEHPPATSGRRALKIYTVAQDQTGPPSFTFYVNRSDMVHFSYKRYLENTLRAAYDFKGSPLRMRFKGRGES
jgi:GTP-binding protein